ncbi:MAG: hypothetical protein SFY80_16525 [Verrucomicrobiota bacterium]|nr:hypothetical protein [Verrucomicrobiota bacterium]
MKRLSIINALVFLVAMLRHWLSVNDLRGAGHELLLKLQYSLVLCTADVEVLQGLVDNQIVLRNQLALLVQQRTLKRASMVNHINGFIRKVRSYEALLTELGLMPVLPKTVRMDMRTMKIAEAGVIVKEAWTSLMAITHPDLPNPFVLNDGTTLAAFGTELETFRQCDTEVENARLAAKTNRIQRDNLLDRKLHAYVIEYRRKIHDLYPPYSEILESLPRLTPPAGTTPAPVFLTGSWNPQTGKAVLNWTASAHADLARYQVRACFDGTYSTDEDTVVANIEKGTLTFITDVGLATNGSIASFKVYAMTNRGRERGSNTVTITHDAAQVAA